MPNFNKFTMLEPLRTNQVGSVHIIPLADNRFVALGSNKVYDSMESVTRSFSRSGKFNENLYYRIVDIQGGQKATLQEYSSITVYNFKGLDHLTIADIVCKDKDLEPDKECLEFLEGIFDEVLVAVEQLNGSEYLVAITKVMAGVHHSLLFRFQRKQ